MSIQAARRRVLWHQAAEVFAGIESAGKTDTRIDGFSHQVPHQRCRNVGLINDVVDLPQRLSGMPLQDRNES
ncbi:hypothetical protein D3C71_1695610 [compost metagenome]